MTRLGSEELASYGVTALWYLAPIDNLPSIFEHGILSHRAVRERRLHHQRIDSRHVQSKRDRIVECEDAPVKVHLHEMVPLFIATDQPMLYVQKDKKAVVQLEIDLSVFDVEGRLFSDGNAARGYTRFFSDARNLSALDWDILATPDCRSEKYKIRKAAEVLVPSPLPASFIRRTHVLNDLALSTVRQVLPAFEDQVVVSEDLYPRRRILPFNPFGSSVRTS